MRCFAACSTAGCCCRCCQDCTRLLLLLRVCSCCRCCRALLCCVGLLVLLQQYLQEAVPVIQLLQS